MKPPDEERTAQINAQLERARARMALITAHLNAEYEKAEHVFTMVTRDRLGRLHDADVYVRSTPSGAQQYSVIMDPVSLPRTPQEANRIEGATHKGRDAAIVAGTTAAVMVAFPALAGAGPVTKKLVQSTVERVVDVMGKEAGKVRMLLDEKFPGLFQPNSPAPQIQTPAMEAGMTLAPSLGPTL